MDEAENLPIPLTPLLLQKIADLASNIIVAGIDGTGMPRVTPRQAGTLAACTIAFCLTKDIKDIFDKVAKGHDHADAIANFDLQKIMQGISEAQKKEADILSSSFNLK